MSNVDPMQVFSGENTAEWKTFHSNGVIFTVPTRVEYLSTGTGSDLTVPLRLPEVGAGEYMVLPLMSSS